MTQGQCIHHPGDYKNEPLRSPAAEIAIDWGLECLRKPSASGHMSGCQLMTQHFWVAKTDSFLGDTRVLYGWLCLKDSRVLPTSFFPLFKIRLASSLSAFPGYPCVVHNFHFKCFLYSLQMQSPLCICLLKNLY